MKRLLFVIFILLFASVSHAQETDLKHEARLSYGINSFPNGVMHTEGPWKGCFTANYMYRVVDWFWVGANINWQFPSDTEYYNWREYETDGTFKDFQISGNNKFLAIAPELRFSYRNTKRTTLYSSFSAGYGISTGTKDIPWVDYYDNYWYWNITYFGANFNIGKKENIVVGFELGLGFKGTIAIHGGYRF